MTNPKIDEISFYKNRFDNFVREMARLKCVEKEYEKLLTLIHVMSARNIEDNSLDINISKNAMASGKSWREICELASYNPTRQP